MHINDFPQEILDKIFTEVADLNAAQGVAWTYGLSQVEPRQSKYAKVARSIRGPVSADSLRWDSVSSLRQVCRAWHGWAIEYACHDLYLRRWRGSERWSELSIVRKLYDTYEMIDRPSGLPVYREPYAELRQSAHLFATYPTITTSIRRLWFSGFFTKEAEGLIFKVLRSCRNLTNISIPWTLLRHGTAEDWVHTLGINAAGDLPLESLELHAVCLPESLTQMKETQVDRQPLLDPRVDFGQLKRLKLFGNTTFMPVNDDDLLAISKTATNLEEFHLTCLSTVSIKGVMSIVKSAQSTLRVLEHSPRSQDGFYHPDPGEVDPDVHICDVLIHCPKLRDLSISMPSVCPHLFSKDDVPWEGECQVRALRLCDDGLGEQGSSNTSSRSRVARANSLRSLLNKSRDLMANNRRTRHAELDVEFFFADCIFDPRDCVVHGDFEIAQLLSHGQWPAVKAASSKGPYGSTGLYGKDEGDWEVVGEEEYFRAVDAGWITI